ncbi:MAG: hypothetical protein ABJN62_08325 [Halioglobus sp.]
MEKLIYPLWKPESVDADAFRDSLLQKAQEWAQLAGVRGLRISVADSAVAAGEQRRMAAMKPLPDGMLSVWLDAATAQRQGIETGLEEVVSRFHCYLVAEAEPVLNTLHPSEPGERVHGMCHVVFLQRPPRLSEDEWLAIWQGSHTQVAIDTQSTFGYRQNVIVRGLSYAAPPLHAMIEENFPAPAMASNYAFYDVEEGDDEGMGKNADAMMESVSRFIDFDRIDVIPMSEYVFKSPA